jgi:hypothetical protein
MKSPMKILLWTIAILIGVPGLFVIAYLGEFPLPDTGGFSRDMRFRSLVSKGDQIKGGGYTFGDGSDVWIRVRLHDESAINLGATYSCSSKELARISAWFRKYAAAPQKILWILPISGGSPADEQALQDTANLRCYTRERHNPPFNEFGQRPIGCTNSWTLYHPPSRFYYARSSCSH